MATFSFVCCWWWWASSAAVFVSRTLRLHRSARYNTLDCQKAGFQYTVAARRKLMALLCSAVDGGIHFADETRKPQQKTGGTPPLVRFRLIRAVDARPCLFSWCASVQWPRKSFAAFPSRCCWLILIILFFSCCTPSPPYIVRSFVPSRLFSKNLKTFKLIVTDVWFGCGSTWAWLGLYEMMTVSVWRVYLIPNGFLKKVRRASSSLFSVLVSWFISNPVLRDRKPSGKIPPPLLPYF